MISGLNIDLKIGPFSVNRAPKIVLESVRGAVAEKLLVELPDPGGQVAAGLSKGDQVNLFFAYRGSGANASQMWQGKISKIQAAKDRLQITALDQSLALIETKVTECFRNEEARVVVKNLFAKAGIAPGRLEGPNEILPHLIFSGLPVWQCFKQINETLARVKALDMSAQMFWADENKKGHWGDFDRPGETPILASGDNLISHNPKGESGEATAILFPGLLHSQKVKIIDDRRFEIKTVRAQSVIHNLGANGHTTKITYGPEKGYA